MCTVYATHLRRCSDEPRAELWMVPAMPCVPGPRGAVLRNAAGLRLGMDGWMDANRRVGPSIGPALLPPTSINSSNSGSTSKVTRLTAHARATNAKASDTIGYPHAAAGRTCLPQRAGSNPRQRDARERETQT